MDPHGAVTVAGKTESNNFPTTPGSFRPIYNGGISDAFVVQIAPAGSQLLYSTFLGGSGADIGFAITLDTLGSAVVLGTTFSSDFPTTPGVVDTTYNGGGTFGGDAFVTRLVANGSGLVYSTYLGGSTNDRGLAVQVDARGMVTVTGDTDSVDFPTTAGSFDTTYNGGVLDGFVARLSSTATSLVYSTFLGGNAGDLPFGLSVDSRGSSSPLFVTALVNSDTRGSCAANLPIPNQSWLAGRQLFAQFAWFGPASPPPCPPSGWSASGALEIRIQP